MSRILNMSRRRFLATGATLSGALVLGFRLGGCAADEAPVFAGTGDFNPNAWLELNQDGQVVINVPWTELGQGVLTAMSMILAEELEADFATVEIRKAWNDPRFGRMGTGGSRSIRTSWDPVRQAGATARVMLEKAAAQHWQVPEKEVYAQASVIHHRPSGRSLPFGDLALAAAELKAPRDVPLKSRDERTLVGTSPRRVDARIKATGEALFGCDHRFENMVMASIERCPVFGGKVKEYDDTGARGVPGVLDVLPVRNGLAVIAEHTWAAIKGREALQVTWDEGAAADLDSAAIARQFQEADAAAAQVIQSAGDLDRVRKAAASHVAVVYNVPFLSHSPMEPMNCTAWLEGDHCHVHGPIQSVTWAQDVAAGVAGVPRENVRVQPTYSGGGFGRRLMVDYVGEVVEIAKALGRPVQLFWTREDDTRHGFYRPASRHRMEGWLDDAGRVLGWHHHLACPSIAGQLNPDSFKDGRDEGAMDGAINLAYSVDTVDMRYSMCNTPVPVGWLRSVYNSQNALANECFVDELAVAAGLDPVQMRLNMLPQDSRLRRTLVRAAEEWGWPRKPVEGRGFGVACHGCFGSYVTNMAEVSVSGGRLRVHKVLAVVDCGPVVHLDGLINQMEGGTAYALSALVGEAITVDKGRVEQGNFDDYQPLRLDEMPEVQVVAMDNEDSIGGIGEPGYPAVGPAVLNAIYDCNGTRVRDLPVLGNL